MHMQKIGPAKPVLGPKQGKRCKNVCVFMRQLYARKFAAHAGVVGLPADLAKSAC